MKIQPIKNKMFLEDAICLYRDFWDRAWEGHSYKQICNFDGSGDDLDMLNYCEYELGYPDKTYDSAAIIWGNVIEKNTKLKWGEDELGNIYLYSEYPRFSINVKAYVHERINSDFSEFDCGSFSFLTEKIAIEMLMVNNSYEDIAALAEIVFQYSGDYLYSIYFMSAVCTLYKKKTDMMNSLREILNDEDES